MTTRVITAPTMEPITLDEAKLHLKVDFTTDDTLISALITAARIYAENYTRRAFITQTLELTIPDFAVCDNIIEIPNPPLQSISWIKYVDFDGVTKTVDPADYQVDTYREPGLVKPAYLSWWPILVRNDFNAVQVRYVAGYAPGSPSTELAANVPEAIKQWMKVRIGTMYEFREAIVAGAIMAPLHRDFVDGLLDPFCVSVF